MKDILGSIPVDALRVFETAARLQSFTRAATQLGMTQAAVSWRIRDLEDRLGHALFIRRARSIALTDQGERLYRPTSEAMALLRRGVSDVLELNNNILSVTALQTLATQWLAARLGQFQISNADLAVRVDTGIALSNLSDDGMDVGLRYGSGQWSGMEARLLFPAVATPMCSPEVYDRLKPKQPSDLKTGPLLGDDNEWAAWFVEAGVDVSQPANSPRMMADSQMMEVAAAMAGQGIVLASPILFARELRNGQLIAPFRETCSIARAYWLCYPTGRRLVPKIARFRDWILQEAHADPVIVQEARRAGVQIGQTA